MAKDGKPRFFRNLQGMTESRTLISTMMLEKEKEQWLRNEHY